MHGNRDKRGGIFLHGSIPLLFSVFFVAKRLHAAGAQKCDTIFEGGDYLVTQGVLDEVKDDFQKLVDCIPDGGKLSLTTGLKIEPISTVVLKNAIELASTGEGNKRPVLTCPDAGEPLFHISSTEVELKNLIVSDCVTESNVTSAVVVDIKKAKGGKTTSLGLTGVDFVDNTNLNGSASIYVKSAESLSLTRVVFSGNVGAHGGGVFLDSGGMEVNVRDCVFEDNTAKFFDKPIEGKGAALFQNASAFLTVSGSRFANNYAGNAGGAMYILGEPPASTLAITNTVFHNNTAGSLRPDVDKDGGAIWARGPTLEFTVKNCTFTENKAIGQGGSIFLLTSKRPGKIKADIKDTLFEKNVAFVGGAIWAQASIQWRMGISISDSKFLKNEALLQHVHPGSVFEKAAEFPFVDPGIGAAIACIGISIDFESKRNLFEKNRAIGLGGPDQRGPQGGAISISNVENVTITDNVFRGNSAINLDKFGKEGTGGAIHFAAVGIESARVLDSPPGSNCELQCDADSDPPGLGLVNTVGGCGVFDSHGRKLCVLTNATECQGVIPQENFIDFRGRTEIGALCEIIVVDSTARVSNTKFVDNLVDGPGGAIFLTDGGATLTLGEGVQFVGNTARNSRGGAVALSDKATLLAEEEIKMESNVAGISGGGFALEGTSANLYLQGGSFIGNKAKNGIGGAITSLSRESNITVMGPTVFRNNEAEESGGAIACLSEASEITLSDATFSNNEAATAGGALHAKSAGGNVNINLENVSFSENRIKSAPGFPLRGKGGAISLEGAAITLFVSGEANTFVSNSAREGGAIRLFDTQKAEISRASITNNIALSGGGLHASFTRKSSELAVNLKNVEFTGNTGYMGGGVMVDARNANSAFVLDDGLTEAVFLSSTAPQTPQVSLNGVRFHKQKVAKDGGAMLLVDVYVAGENCDFQDNKAAQGFDGGGGAVKLADFARFDLTSGTFTGNQAVDGGALFVSDSSFNGKDVEFSNNSAFGKGGSIAVEGFAQGDRSMVTLEDSKIDGNVAELGGGIFWDVLESEGINAVCQIEGDSTKNEDLTFVQNVVTDACQNRERSSLASTLSVVLKNTVISNNEAKKAGGGMFIGDPTLVCACCGKKCSKSCSTRLNSSFGLKGACAALWKGNSLGKGGYGPIVAAFASSVDVIKLNGRLLEKNEVLDVSPISGQAMAPLKVQMKDFFNQVVTFQRLKAFAQVTLESTEGRILFGQAGNQVKDGVFNATIVSAFPGEYQLRMSFPGLEVKDVPFRVRVRECVRGEKFSTSFSCRQCEEGHFSFRPDQSCTLCPASSTCDTRTLTPIDGYWHSSSWSESIHKCLVDAACSYSNRSKILRSESELSGAKPLHFTSQSLCREGYEGPLCGSCARGYGRVRAFECQECLSKRTSIPLLIAMVFWMVIVVGFIIRNALKAGTPVNIRVDTGSEEDFTGNVEPSSAIYLGVNPATENAKILINFLQITSIALVINVEWREEVRRTLQIEDIATGFSTDESILPFDCPLEESSVPVSIRRTILAMLLPFTMMVVPTFFVLRGYFDKSRSHLFYRQALVSCLVVAYVFYTGMTKRALRSLHGVSVDSMESETMFAKGRFWADDTNIEYFGGEHAYLAILLGLPVLLLYSIGFPTYLFYVLWGNKDKLNDESFARSYGFLYRAYHNKYVYWEIVVMARKALLVGIVVFVYELGGNLQSVLAAGVLMAALVLHLTAQPYREELSQMNRRETLSLCVSVFTYLTGVAFNDDRLPAWSEVVLSVLLVVATSALVIYLVWALAAESARHLETLLEEKEIVVPENATTWLKMRLLADFYWFRVMDSFWHYAELGIAWTKGKKSHQKPTV